jgi:hypothetical protein
VTARDRAQHAPGDGERIATGARSSVRAALDELAALERPQLLAYEGRRREAIQSPAEALKLDRCERLDDPQVLSDNLRRSDSDLKTDPAGAIALRIPTRSLSFATRQQRTLPARARLPATVSAVIIRLNAESSSCSPP